MRKRVTFQLLSGVGTRSLIQLICGIRSKDSIGRAQPHESGHEQDAHG
jgi:hypothetical protein